jgi:hypothetical protein
MAAARQAPGEWGGGLILSRQPVRVEAGHESAEGYLVFADDRLVAVLVCQTPNRGDIAAQWHLGAGFGRLEGPDRQAFASLDMALDWIALRLSRSTLGS